MRLEVPDNKYLKTERAIGYGLAKMTNEEELDLHPL